MVLSCEVGIEILMKYSAIAVLFSWPDPCMEELLHNANAFNQGFIQSSQTLTLTVHNIHVIHTFRHILILFALMKSSRILLD